VGTRLATKRATSVSDTMALIRALRGRGFAADLKGSKNEKEEFGLGGHQQKTVIPPVKYLLNVQYRKHLDKVRGLVVWQEQGEYGSYIELVDSGRRCGLVMSARRSDAYLKRLTSHSRAFVVGASISQGPRRAKNAFIFWSRFALSCGVWRVRSRALAASENNACSKSTAQGTPSGPALTDSDEKAGERARRWVNAEEARACMASRSCRSASRPVNRYDSVCLLFDLSCSSDALSDVDAAS